MLLELLSRLIIFYVQAMALVRKAMVTSVTGSRPSSARGQCSYEDVDDLFSEDDDDLEEEDEDEVQTEEMEIASNTAKK